MRRIDRYSKTAHKEMDLHNSEVGKIIGISNVVTLGDELVILFVSKWVIWRIYIL